MNMSDTSYRGLPPPTTLRLGAPGTYSETNYPEPIPYKVLYDLATRKHSGQIHPCGFNRAVKDIRDVGNFYTMLLRGILSTGNVFDFGLNLNDPDDTKLSTFMVPFYTEPMRLYNTGKLMHPFGSYGLTYVTHEPCRELIVIGTTSPTQFAMASYIATPNTEGRLVIRLCASAQIRQNQNDDYPELSTFEWGWDLKSNEYSMMQTNQGWAMAYVGRALWLLQQPGVTRTAAGATAAQNKSRRMVGRPPLPSQFEMSVPSHYVTRIVPVNQATPKGGTHASPHAHERRGHWYTRKATGMRHWIRAHQVKPDNPGPDRIHYEVRPQP